VTNAKNIRTQTWKLILKCELELVCIWNIFLVKKDSYVKREERKPTRCNNIDDLLSIVDVDY